MSEYNYNRIFDVSKPDNPSLKVSVTLPKSEDGHDYFCVLRFSGLGQKFEKKQYGVSAMQAFSLAISRANYLILNSAEFANGSLVIELSDGETEPLTRQLLGMETSEWHEYR